MVRKFSKFPKKPAGWLPPSAPLHMRKQVFLYVFPYDDLPKANTSFQKDCNVIKGATSEEIFIHPLHIHMH